MTHARAWSPRIAARVAALAAALAVATLVHALVLVLISGRTRRPEDRRDAARATVAAAVGGPAARWAAAELQTATAALAAAEAEYRRQERRPWPWRDYRGAADALWSAEAAARRAHRAGEERLVAVRADAEDALDDALDLLATAEGLVAITALPVEERGHLSRARLLVAEAGALLRSGELEKAASRAGEGRAELDRALGPSLVRARRYASEDQIRTWRRWIEDTRAWSRASGRAAVVVVKERNELRLLERGLNVSVYPADIGQNAVGRKLRAGDLATPEGRYRVVAKKARGRTRYHKALLLDYPNDADRRRIAEARRAGMVPREAQAGGLIEIHGDGGRGRNWTDGCVALANPHMDEVFARIEVGSWVTIVGGDGESGAFSDLSQRLDGAGDIR